MGFDARQDEVAPGIFVNPGTGPVADTSEAHASLNIAAFAAEVGATDWRGPLSEERGRYTYMIGKGGREVEVAMPGLPLAEVRYVGADDQNIWDYPRLYVDGSSWVWLYALSALDVPEDDAA